MTVVRSPRLRRCGGTFISTARRDNWVCYGPLDEFIEVPDAKFYWLEASTHQWKDGSGKQVLCRIRRGWDEDYAEYFRESYRFGPDWNELYRPTIRPLKQLGLRSDGESKVIYFRLLYQE